MLDPIAATICPQTAFIVAVEAALAAGWSDEQVYAWLALILDVERQPGEEPRNE